jgi:hypothetical protein
VQQDEHRTVLAFVSAHLAAGPYESFDFREWTSRQVKSMPHPRPTLRVESQQLRRVHLARVAEHDASHRFMLA